MSIAVAKPLHEFISGPSSVGFLKNASSIVDTFVDLRFLTRGTVVSSVSLAASTDAMHVVDAS